MAELSTTERLKCLQDQLIGVMNRMKASSGPDVDLVTPPSPLVTPSQDSGEDPILFACASESSTPIQSLPQNLSHSTAQYDASLPELKIPQWYKQYETQETTEPEYEKQKIISYLKTVYDDIKYGDRAVDKIEELRQESQKLRYETMTGRTIKSKKGLELLKQIAEDFSLPWDIRLDVRMIFKDWARKQFDTDLMHGITGSRIIPDYQFKVQCGRAGHNGLEVGQWWPLKICASRDGAHGKPFAGIDKHSIILSHTPEYPDDEDLGDTIFYTGTVAKNKLAGETTWGTQKLLEAISSQTPQRVIRKSSDKRDGSRFLPPIGLRYDGLYMVNSVTKKEKPDGTVYLFKLTRLPGQPPIRHKGEGMRPNSIDLAMVRKCKEKRKGQ